MALPASALLWLLVATACSDRDAARSAVLPVTPSDEGMVVLLGEPLEFAGEADEGERVARTVEVRSDCDGPRDVRVVMKTCGCVDALLDGTRLEPGHSVSVTMGVQVGGSSNEQQQWIKLGVFLPGEEELLQVIPVGLSYRSRRDYLVTPEEVAIVTDAGAPFERLVCLRRPDLASPMGDVRVELLGIEGVTAEVLGPGVLLAGPPGQRPVDSPADRLADGTNDHVTRIVLRGRLPSVGLLEGRLLIHADTRIKLPIRLPVAIRVQSSVVATPAGVVVQAGECPLTREVALRPRPAGGAGAERGGRAPVASVVPSHPGLRARLSETGDMVSVEIGAAVAPFAAEIALLDRDGRRIGTVPVAVLPGSVTPRPADRALDSGPTSAATPGSANGEPATAPP